MRGYITYIIGYLISCVCTHATMLELGNPSTVAGVDGWRSIMIVNENDLHTNTTTAPQNISVDTFNCYINANRGRITPFVVKVHGDNDFTVIAIGAPRSSGVDYTATGAYSYPFTSDPITFVLQPGETMGVGFTNADADGSGNDGSVIGFVNGEDEIWLTGGRNSSDAGQVINGQAPLDGASTLTNLERAYRFSIGFTISVDPAPPSDILLDNTFIYQLLSIGASWGQLSTIDVNATNTHTYSLVSGLGDTHNGLFTITNDLVYLEQPLPANDELSIRVRALDSDGLSLEKAFSLFITERALVINEFVADNETGIEDEDGDRTDWIELLNLSGSTIDLSGYYLTDNTNDLTRWRIPAITMNARDFLVIHASGKDRSPTNGLPLHTNFKLKRTGEEVALVAPDGTTVIDLLYPRNQYDDIAYGMGAGNSGIGYLIPTPGAANGAAFSEGVSTVTFSQERGFYGNPFQLTLTSSLPGSIIRYTTNGTAPDNINGMDYSAPITVTPSTAGLTHGTFLVRAIALNTNAIQTPIASHTYLFVHEIVQQSGFLSAITNQPAYYNLLDDALTALPVVSIAHPLGLPGTLERESSIEFFDPQQAEPGFQATCGIKKVGGHSVNSPKNNFRLYFRQQYGQQRLTYPLFMDHPYSGNATDTFQRLNLRGGSHDTFFWLANPNNPGNSGGPTKGDALYLRNRLLNDLQLRMGHEGLHGRFVNLYINGEYRGQYHLHEWPNDDFLASYEPGGEDDFEYTNGANPGKAHSDNWQAAWDAMKAAATTGIESGNDWLDAENLMDYMLLSFYAGNPWDWNPNQNWMAAGPNTANGLGWKFFHWDADICLQDENANVLNKNVPDGLFLSIISDPDYALLFRDRVYEHCFHGGILTPDVITETFTNRVNEIQTSIVAETARWQGAAANPPWDRDDEWQNEIDRINQVFIPQRTDILLNQLRAQGWYPVEAPAFNQRGGSVPIGFEVILTAPAGTIYFTTDGSDPTDSQATIYSPGMLLINQAVHIKTRALHNGEWSPVNQAFFLIDGTPLLSTADVMIEEVHYNPPGSDEAEFIELHNRRSNAINLAGSRLQDAMNFVFPAEQSVLEPDARIVVVENLEAFSAIYQDPTSPYYWPGIHVAGQWSGQLDNNGESIQVVGPTGLLVTNAVFSPIDHPGRANGKGSSLEYTPTHIRPSSEYLGSPGRAGLGPDNRIVINEILAHTNSNTFDQVELYCANATLNIGGWFLSDTSEDYRRYMFPSNTVMIADSYRVITGAALGFGLDREGDDLYLLEANANGDLLRFVDRVEFGATAQYESIGRLPNGLGDLVPLLETSFGAANGQARIGPVIISDVQYNPEGSPDTFREYLRFFNIGSHTEQLAGWQLRGEVDFDFPAWSLSPGESVTLVGFALTDAQTIAAFEAETGIVPDLGPWIRSGTSPPPLLDNAGGSLVLFRPDTIGAEPPYPMLTEDLADYQPGPAWPHLANGFGPRLVRIRPPTPGTEPASWIASDLPHGYLDWALDTFSNTNNIAPGDDFDNNGRDNLYHYTFNDNARLRIENGQLTYQRRASGLTVQLEGRDDLHNATWQEMILPATTDPLPDGAYEEVRHTLPNLGEQYYFRVRGELP